MRRRATHAIIVVTLAIAVLAIGAFAAVLRVRLATVHDHGDPSRAVDLRARFATLATGRTNQCGGGTGHIAAMRDDEHIQGSCCSAMDFHRYAEQITGLTAYAYVPEIPSDPYDVPAADARRLLAYRDAITLTSAQQATYDDAVRRSHEGGPCCCKCWHWDAYEGLAKHLIVNHSFTAQQVADVWDLSDACGGSGHEHGEAV